MTCQRPLYTLSPKLLNPELYPKPDMQADAGDFVIAATV